nr:MAG TPA: hypothetical protein [Caudoviricetes sp.]
MCQAKCLTKRRVFKYNNNCKENKRGCGQHSSYWENIMGKSRDNPESH